MYCLHDFYYFLTDCLYSIPRPTKDRLTLVGQDCTVVNVALLELLHCRLETLLGHGELLDHWLDVVQASEREHLLVLSSVGDERSLDVDTLDEDGHVWDAELSVRDR